MKIAMIADRVGPPALPAAADPGGPPCAYPGDAASGVRSLARALAELRHQVTIYARQDAAGLPAAAGLCPGVTVEYLEAGPRERLAGDRLLPHIAAFAGQLADRWPRSAPDVVHAHSWTSGMAALAGARDLDIPVVQSFLSLGTGQADRRRPARGGAAKAIRLQAAVGRSAAAVLARTDAEAAELGRRGMPHASIRLVPSGVDTARFRPQGPAADRSDRSRLLMFASLAARQELATVLHALARVPDAELVVAGGPPRDQLDGDRGYRAAARLTRQLGLAGRVSFTGRLSRAAAPALMRSADLLVSMSAADPFGVVALDAMACGVPVIASAAGLHQDAVIDGITGFLVPPGKPMLLASRIGQLLANPMLREGYGIAAASRAQDRYSWTRIGAETVAVYESLLRRPADTAA
jgi:glycosyltransferase involved in cell wall biosynthesis